MQLTLPFVASLVAWPIVVTPKPEHNPLLPLTIEVHQQPTPFRADGATTLAYEVLVENFLPRDITLISLEVFDADTGDSVGILEGAELERNLGRPGVIPGKRADARVLGGGLRAVVFLWLVPPGAAPRRLRHRLTMRTTNPGNALVERWIDGAAVDVATGGPVVIGPPVRGAGWVARFSGRDGFHRRAVFPVNGHLQSAQRFAIDWGKYDERWQAQRADAGKNSDWVVHGEPVIAVADARVVRIVDGIAENDPGAAPGSLPVGLDSLFGNHVVIDLGKSRFAVYAHLAPGSIRVRPGQRVRRGETLGAVGNSGNSIGPHLHFHVSDAEGPLEGDGVPFVIDAYETIGRESNTQFEQQSFRPATDAAWQSRRRQLPVDAEVLRFPDRSVSSPR